MDEADGLERWLCIACGEPAQPGHYATACRARLEPSADAVFLPYTRTTDEPVRFVSELVATIEASERELLDPPPPWVTRAKVVDGYPRVISWGRVWGRAEAMRKAEARATQRLEVACQRALDRRGLAGLGFGLAASHGAPGAPGRWVAGCDFNAAGGTVTVLSTPDGFVHWPGAPP